MTAAPSRGAVAIVVLVFLAAGLAGIRHHEMWRDELQAWMLASDSPTPWALLGALRYEGHPPLWYALLYPLARAWPDPAAMQLLHLLVATASVAILYAFAPLASHQRLLLCFGYYFFYEYAIVSRSYALGVLCVMAFAALSARGAAPLARAVALGALCLTSLHGLLLAACLAPLLPWRTAGRRGPLVLLLACAAIAVVVARPAPDFASPVVTTELSWNPVRARAAFDRICWSYLPLPDFRSEHSWNSGLVRGWPATVAAAALVGLGIAWLWGSGTPLLAYLVGTAALVAFSYVKVLGVARHIGHLFLLLVACLWAARARHGAPPPGRVASLALTALCSVQAAAGLHAYARDLWLPFTAAPAAADFIRRQLSPDIPIVAEPDVAGSAVAAHLRRPLHYLRGDRFGTFITWDRARMAPPSRPFERIVERMRARAGPVALLSSSRLPIPGSWPVELGSCSVAELGSFDDALVPDEVYRLYLVAPPGTRRGAIARTSATTASVPADTARPTRPR